MRLQWLAVLLLVPVAGAELAGEDPEGDVQYRTAVPGSDPQYTDPPRDEPAPDILSVAAVEASEDLLALELELRGGDSPSFNPERAVYFTFGGVQYRVKDTGCAFESNEMSLQVLNTGSRAFERVGCVEAEQDGPVWRTFVPKHLVRNEAGLPAGLGSVITDLWAETWAMVAPSTRAAGATTGTDAVDRAPDEETYDGALVFELGEGGFGDFLFASPTPLRASNGGPDTMVFAVTLENRGDPDVVLLSVPDVPSGWSVRHPARLALAEDEVRTFPVIVTTASAHAHGSTQRFLLEAQSGAGDTGFLELGIHYLGVPQLAGHHPDLYIHSAPIDADYITTPNREFRTSWFNTVPEQDGADDAPIQAPSGPTSGPEATRTWRVPLDPALLIGMDFDLNDLGDLVLGFVSDDSIGEMAVAMRLMHCHSADVGGESQGAHGCPEGSWFQLAQTDETLVDVMPDQAFTIDEPLQIDAYADLVPYVEGSNIALWVSATMVTAPIVENFPSLDPKTSFMRLPLNEYKDPLDAEFEDLGALTMTGLDGFEKRANAGQSVWFSFLVANHGDQDRRVRLDAVGHAAETVHRLPAEPFDLAAGTERTVAFEVAIPDDAVAGSFVEVFGIVEDLDEPAVSALSKFRVMVVDEPVQQAERPDVAAPREKSPGLPAFLVLGALAALAVRRR